MTPINYTVNQTPGYGNTIPPAGIPPAQGIKPNPNYISGYSVTALMTAKVRKIDSTGAIIDAASTAGGNFIQVNGISFALDNPSSSLSQARTNAMTDAEARASQLGVLPGRNSARPHTLVSHRQVTSQIQSRTQREP